MNGVGEEMRADSCATSDGGNYSRANETIQTHRVLIKYQHPCGEWHLRDPQPGRAQPPGLAQGEGGHQRRAGPPQVHLRDPQEGYISHVPGAQPGPNAVQRVCLRLTPRG